MVVPIDNAIIDKIASDHLEEATEVSEKVDSLAFVEGTKEEKALVRKIDLWLMPTVWILLLFNYVDRSNVGNAKVAGMVVALNLSDNDYYLVIILFQTGYVVGGPVSSMILPYVRPTLYISLLMALWGTCVACIAAVQATRQLLATRILLGLLEARFIMQPAVLFLISSWYRKHEQQVKRIMFFYSSAVLAGAFGGIVAGAIEATLDGAHGIAGWRWLFIVEGVPTVGLALMTPFFLLNYPATSRKFSDSERKLATARQFADGITNRAVGEKLHLGPFKAFFVAIFNWRIWILSIPYMQLVGASSLAYLYPTLVNALGYTAVASQFRTAPIYMVALIVSIPICCAGVMAFGCLFCALGTGILSYSARYVFLCFINTSIWAGAPIAISFATSSLGGCDPEVRAISIGILIALAQLAPIYASNIFPASDAPVYRRGFSTYTALFGLGAIVSGLGHFLMKKYPYKSAR